MKYKKETQTKAGARHTSYVIRHTRESAGFTLVEMIVAVALFAIVMVVAVGALLALTGANKKAQAIQSVMNNLNITLDGMVRNIRMGTEYHCGVGSYSGSSADSCAGGKTSFTFTCNPGTASCAQVTSRWAYQFVCPSDPNIDADETCSSGGYIQRSQNGGAANSWTRLTAGEVSIERVVCYGAGARTRDLVQPIVVMVVSGTAGGENVKTKTRFHIQATAVQRELDL